MATQSPCAGATVAVEVMSEHEGSTRLGVHALANTRVTGVPREKLVALLRAVVSALTLNPK